MATTGSGRADLVILDADFLDSAPTVWTKTLYGECRK